MLLSNFPLTKRFLNKTIIVGGKTARKAIPSPPRAKCPDQCHQSSYKTVVIGDLEMIATVVQKFEFYLILT